MATQLWWPVQIFQVEMLSQLSLEHNMKQSNHNMTAKILNVQ